MIKKVFYVVCLTLLSNIVSSQDDDVLSVSELEVGFNTTEDLPEDIKLGVIGNLLVTGKPEVSDSPTNRSFSSVSVPKVSSQILKTFALIVLGGMLMADLGLGSSDLYKEDYNNSRNSRNSRRLPDYVFEPDYDLPSLEDTKAYVEKYKHLPNIIGIAELKEQGYYSVNDMLIGQLKNLEELVLHTIDQEKQIDHETAEIRELETLITALENRLDQLENK